MERIFQRIPTISVSPFAFLLSYYYIHWYRQDSFTAFAQYNLSACLSAI
ncbi:hypothetical protein HMPREF1860_01587 [Prevotella amnii]|uniref:Uncharacterized protein n=1 Tax=Prevotella amnii TaxID=419005 RepID=A0A134B9A2_9BACT|nr:hypothetical protein HMPREF1860_01587 [Prevotella amnii]